MEPRAFAKTDVGRKRSHNEDAFLVDPSLGLFAVADGMGGHQAGEVAAARALDVIQQEMANWSAILDEFCREGSAEVRDVIINLIEETIQRACRAVFQDGASSPDRKGMGTTLSMVLIRGSAAFVGHVGDSRVYLLREQSVHQLTEDHSLVRELLKKGRIGLKGAKHAKFKNVITRAIGHKEHVQVDTVHLDLVAGDRLLLCSDGLHGCVPEEELARVLSTDPLAEAPGRLVNLANQHGGPDNITAVVVEIPAEREDLDRDVRRGIELLREAPLFAYLSSRELLKLMDTAYVRRVSEGQYLARAGEQGDEMLILLEGEARELDENEQEVARLKPGDCVEVVSLFMARPRTTGVQALSPGQVLVLRRDTFYRLVEEDKKLVLAILWRLIQLQAGGPSSRHGEKDIADILTSSEELAPPWLRPKD